MDTLNQRRALTQSLVSTRGTGELGTEFDPRFRARTATSTKLSTQLDIRMDATRTADRGDGEGEGDAETGSAGRGGDDETRRGTGDGKYRPAHDDGDGVFGLAK